MYILRRIFRAGLLCVCLMLMLPAIPSVCASEEHEPGKPAARIAAGYDDDALPAAGGEETSVFVSVPRIGGLELPVIISGSMVYLPVGALFEFLKIRNTVSAGADSVSGYFIDEQRPYSVDARHYRIYHNGKLWQLSEREILQSASDVLLRYDQLSTIFGLHCVFDYRNLTVRLTSSFELPAVRQQQLELMRRNLNHLRGATRADTAIGRSGAGLHLGTADWAFSGMQFSDGRSDYRLGLGLGAFLAGGEATVRLTLNNSGRFDQRQQFYQWRYVNNEHAAFRQLSLGRIFPQAASSIFDPVVGIQVSNAPTSYRQSFGSYRITRTVQPGWTVELYVNNNLIDYATADAAGNVTFDVPLVYGSSQVKLRFFGPYGEERNAAEEVSIPYNFLPKGEYEYIASAGIVLDTLSSRFARAGINYGLTPRLTVGAGTEYLSSVRNRPAMPFVNAAVRIGSKLMLTADYTTGVRGRASLSYRLPYGAQLELNYSRFAKDQHAIVYNYLEERRGGLSLPYRTRGFYGLTRLTYTGYLITNLTRYTTAEWLVSANFRSFSANVNTYLFRAMQRDPQRAAPTLYSTVSLSFRLPFGYTLTPAIQYSLTGREVVNGRCELEKYLFKRGFLNISVERNLISNTYSAGAGLRYDLSFGRLGLAARRFNNTQALTVTGAGSLLFDAATKELTASLRPTVGRGGVVLRAFLDLNANGVRDSGEPAVPGLQARAGSGRAVYSDADTVLRIFELEPWINAVVDVSRSNFDHAGWVLHNKTLSVLVEPNNMKLVEVAVDVRSEASGTIRMSGKAQGRVRICFTRGDGSPAGCAMTDADGYYNLTGLPPGHYTVQPDAAQLAILGLKAYPASIGLDVIPKLDGDIVDRLDFLLK